MELAVLFRVRVRDLLSKITVGPEAIRPSTDAVYKLMQTCGNEKGGQRNINAQILLTRSADCSTWFDKTEAPSFYLLFRFTASCRRDSQRLETKTATKLQSLCSARKRKQRRSAAGAELGAGLLKKLFPRLGPSQGKYRQFRFCIAYCIEPVLAQHYPVA